MSKHNLEILFDSRPRLKILKFLFRNLTTNYTLREIVNHSREGFKAVRSEIRRLLDIGLLKKMARKPTAVFMVNRDFEYFSELRNLILIWSPSDKARLLENINKLGKIKLAVIAGIFLDKENKDQLAVDVFLVGDDIERRKLTNFLKNLEAEIGKEVRFATMEREEFKYRLSMFDRFVRVLFESPHEKLIDKLGVDRMLHP